MPGQGERLGLLRPCALLLTLWWCRFDLLFFVFVFIFFVLNLVLNLVLILVLIFVLFFVFFHVGASGRRRVTLALPLGRSRYTFGGCSCTTTRQRRRNSFASHRPQSKQR